MTGGTIRWGANDWGTGLPESERQNEGARCAAAECLKIVVVTRVGCVSCRLWRGGGHVEGLGLSWLRLSLRLWRWRWRGERARARVWHMLSIFHVRPDSALMCESDTGHGLRGVTLMDYCCSGPLGWGICIF